MDQQLKGQRTHSTGGSRNSRTDAVAYLAGPEAGFVTGASLMIDGGFTA